MTLRGAAHKRGAATAQGRGSEYTSFLAVIACAPETFLARATRHSARAGKGERVHSNTQTDLSVLVSKVGAVLELCAGTRAVP